MDRVLVKGMVEDYWRAILPAMQNSGASSVNEIGARFEQRVNETAALMPPLEGAAFLQMVDTERETIIAEYQANPVALKRRLGVPLGVDAPAQHYVPRGEGLGDLVVKTAIRATIWQSIWRLFR